PNWTGQSPYLHTRPLNNTQLNPATLDISQFSENALGTYGNLSRNVFIGPKLLNLDSSLSRVFPLHERLAIMLRLEAFNVLNHPAFSNPGSNLNSPGAFGRLTTTVTGSNPRLFQGALKFTF